MSGNRWRWGGEAAGAAGGGGGAQYAYLLCARRGATSDERDGFSGARSRCGALLQGLTVAAVHVLRTLRGGARPHHVRTPCALALYAANYAHDVPCLQVPAQRSSARPCCALGVHVQFVVDLPRLAQTALADIVSCGTRSSTTLTSRGCAGPYFMLALCMLALSHLRRPCSRCVHPLCMRLLCMPSFLRACVSHPAGRALAMRARAVCLRVVCGVLVQRLPTSCGAR